MNMKTANIILSTSTWLYLLMTVSPFITIDYYLYTLEELQIYKKTKNRDIKKVMLNDKLYFSSHYSGSLSSMVPFCGFVPRVETNILLYEMNIGLR